MICRRAVVLLLSHISYEKLKNISIRNIYEIEMGCDKQTGESFYIVPHKIKKTYSENDYKVTIGALLSEIEKE